MTASVQRFLIHNGYVACCAYVGAGVKNSGTLTLSYSIVSENTADVNSHGGGIYTDGIMTLNDSNVSENQSLGNGRGGGIFNAGNLTIYNSTINNNQSALESGGGIYNEGSLILNNNTISGNGAAFNGGGLFNSGTVTAQNSIIAGNTASMVGSDCNGVIGSSGYNLIGTTAGCNFTPSTGDLININPKVGRLIGSPGYLPLLPDSPAIDTGSPAPLGSGGDSCNALDQRGASPIDRCDIGAYEYTPPGPIASIWAVSGTPQRTAPSTALWYPLQAAVVDNIGSPVNNAIITFSAPPSGVSGVFADTLTYTTTSLTDVGGIARASAFTANSLQGSYLVTASVGEIITPTIFTLSNTGWYVSSSSGNDANDCQTPGTACATINSVLAKTTSNDTVLVTDGNYTGDGTEVVLLNKNVRLLGGWNLDFTTQNSISTIDSQGARRKMTIAWGVTASIERFSVQNGNSWQWSGGIVNYGDLTLDNCDITNNTGYDGGGISNSGTMTLKNSNISHNTANNILNDAGCIQTWGSEVKIINNVISDNNGGGINGVAIKLINSTVSGNTVMGINIQAGDCELTNSTVSSNTGQYWLTGGISIGNGTLAINSSTISNNTAGAGSGGINSVGGAYVTIQNSIVTGNTGSGPDCSGTINSVGYNLIGNTSECNFIPAIGDLLDVNAFLLPLEGLPGYHPLWINSPAVDAGNPAGCKDQLGNPLFTDERSTPRPLDGDRNGNAICDIGAYELDLEHLYPIFQVLLPITTRGY